MWVPHQVYCVTSSPPPDKHPPGAPRQICNACRAASRALRQPPAAHSAHVASQRWLREARARALRRQGAVLVHFACLRAPDLFQWSILIQPVLCITLCGNESSPREQLFCKLSCNSFSHFSCWCFHRIKHICESFHTRLVYCSVLYSMSGLGVKSYKQNPL